MGITIVSTSDPLKAVQEAAGVTPTEGDTPTDTPTETPATPPAEPAAAATEPDEKETDDTDPDDDDSDDENEVDPEVSAAARRLAQARLQGVDRGFKKLRIERNTAREEAATERRNREAAEAKAADEARRRETAERELAELKAGNKTTAAAEPEAPEPAAAAPADDTPKFSEPKPERPKWDTFDDNEAYEAARDKYEDELAEWFSRKTAFDTDQRWQANEKKRAQEEADRQAQAAADASERERVAIATKVITEELPDYDQVIKTIGPDVHLHEAVLARVRSSPNYGTKTVYYLAQNPDELKRIAGLPPVDQYEAVVKLETKIEAGLIKVGGKKAATTPPKPAPAKPVSVAATERDDEQDDDEPDTSGVQVEVESDEPEPETPVSRARRTPQRLGGAPVRTATTEATSISDLERDLRNAGVIPSA